MNNFWKPIRLKFNEFFQHYQKKFERITISRKTELWLAGCLSIIIGILFSIYGRGGPNSSDIELYMNIGMSGLKVPFVLNRYFHIFLQQFFIALAPTPLEGYHLFWGFLIGLSTFLVYFSSRFLFKESNIFNGLFGVMFFFSMSALGTLSGIVVVDFTAMTMILLIFSAYVYSSHIHHENRWIIMMIGLLFFLGFKTKETVLPVMVLFLGFGWGNKTRFNFKKLLLNILWLSGGVLAGVFLFSILSWIFLGDPLFGLRPSEWKEFLSTYGVQSSSVLQTINKDDGNLQGSWYQQYWFKDTFLVFLIYVISGVQIRPSKSLLITFSWLIPIAHTLFLVLTINNSFGYLPRFTLPALPIVGILAAQSSSIEFSSIKHRHIHSFLFFVIGLFLIVATRLFFRFIFPLIGVDLMAFIRLIFYPILVSIMLGLFFFSQNNFFLKKFNYLIIVSLLLSPIVGNFQQIFIYRANEKLFEKATEPLSDFEDEIQFSKDTKIYASEQALMKSPLGITKNIDELMSLFNIYFDRRATRSNFRYGAIGTDVKNEIKSLKFDYLIISLEEWESIVSEKTILNCIEGNYDYVQGPSDQFVLLSRNEDE